MIFLSLKDTVTWAPWCQVLLLFLLSLWPLCLSLSGLSGCTCPRLFSDVISHSPFDSSFHTVGSVSTWTTQLSFTAPGLSCRPICLKVLLNISKISQPPCVKSHTHGHFLLLSINLKPLAPFICWFIRPFTHLFTHQLNKCILSVQQIWFAVFKYGEHSRDKIDNVLALELMFS